MDKDSYSLVTQFRRNRRRGAIPIICFVELLVIAK